MKRSGIRLALLPLLCIGAKRASGERFEEFHAMSQSSAPLRLDDASYDQITAAPEIIQW